MRWLKTFFLSIFITILLFSNTVGLKAQIENRESLIIGVKDNLRPLAFIDASGELQGLEIDIAKRLAKELLGNEDAVTLLPVANQERLDIVMEGKADLVIAKMTVTASRSRLVDFSPYYYLDGTAIVTKSPSIKNMQDLAQERVAVLNQSSTIPIVREKLPTAKLVGVDSYQEAHCVLESGEAVAFAADQSILAGWVQEYSEYRILAQRLSGEPLAIVMPKGLQYSSLRTKVNQAIAQAQASGWLREKATYWGLP